MKNHKIVRLALLVVVVFGSGFYFLRFREPVYQGIALSTWLEELENFYSKTGATHEREAEAVRQIGSKALPSLLKMLRAKDSKLKMKLMEWSEKQSLFEFHFSSARERRWWAVRGFEALGPVAKPVIPALIELFNDEDEEIAFAAMDALAGIGSESILPVIRALKNRNNRVRVRAAMNLGYIPSGGQTVVPALLRSLEDKDSNVRTCAAVSLGQIGKEPNVVVPALIGGLQDTNASVRASSASALSKFGKQAHSAIPALLNALQDQDRIVRIRATSALLKIDPEAAAKAGVRFPVF